LRALIDKLLFRVEKSGDRFTLSRTVVVSRQVRHERLTLDEVEELLGTWKLVAYRVDEQVFFPAKR
jgi:hypothetical protein